jgi:hydroxyacid-oxoacid transhydrogenase
MKATGMPNGLGAIGYSAADVTRLVEGTIPQQRITRLSPRAVTPEALGQLFGDSMTLW